MSYWLSEQDPPSDEVVVPPDEVARLKRLGLPIRTVEEAEWDHLSALERFGGKQ